MSLGIPPLTWRMRSPASLVMGLGGAAAVARPDQWGVPDDAPSSGPCGAQPHAVASSAELGEVAAAGRTGKCYSGGWQVAEEGSGGAFGSLTEPLRGSRTGPDDLGSAPAAEAQSVVRPKTMLFTAFPHYWR